MAGFIRFYPEEDSNSVVRYVNVAHVIEFGIAPSGRLDDEGMVEGFCIFAHVALPREHSQSTVELLAHYQTFEEAESELQSVLHSTANLITLPIEPAVVRVFSIPAS